MYPSFGTSATAGNAAATSVTAAVLSQQQQHQHIENKKTEKQQQGERIDAMVICRTIPFTYTYYTVYTTTLYCRVVMSSGFRRI